MSTSIAYRRGFSRWAISLSRHTPLAWWSIQQGSGASWRPVGISTHLRSWTPLIQRDAPSTAPATLRDTYPLCGCHARADQPGFQQIFDKYDSLGKEARLCDLGGHRVFGERSQIAVLPAKSTLNLGWRLPITQETGTAPSIGQRLVFMGGLHCSPKSTRPATDLPMLPSGDLRRSPCGRRRLIRPW